MATKKEPSARAKRLWTRFNQWYGVRLLEMYGDTPPEEWCRVVDRHSNADIVRALEYIRRRNLAHPPTIPEFEQALRPQPRPTTYTPTAAETFSTWIVLYKPLSLAQVAGIEHWTWLYEPVQWTDAKGESREEPAKLIGVEVPGYGRVMLSEMDERHPEAPDNYTAFANRRLLAFLMKRGDVSERALPELVAAKNRIAAGYRQIETEERVTPEEFAGSLTREFERVLLEART